MAAHTVVVSLLLLQMVLLRSASGGVFPGASCSHAPTGSKWFIRDDKEAEVFYECINNQPTRKTCFSKTFCACIGKGCKETEAAIRECALTWMCPVFKPSNSQAGVEIHTDTCKPNPCKNRAECKATSTDYTCQCRNGFSGKKCEKDACRPSPCGNRGWCRRASHGGYLCRCRRGRSGKNCEIDACKTAAPCTNGGYCKRLWRGRSKCICQPGFLGATCQTYACAAKPCQNGGRCLPKRNRLRYQCRCKTGFTGVRCEINNLAGKCQPNPCKNNGVCTATTSGHSCKCANGYSGPTCLIDACTPSPCQHGGRCSRTAAGYSCSCLAGYSGRSCEVDACKPNPCDHDGTCTRTSTGFTCSCEHGYSGNTCDIDACHPNPCKNGGKCSRRRGGFSCDCEEGFSGDTCVEKVAVPTTSGEFFRCRYGFASMKNPTGGLKDEEQCQTWCYVREDSTSQTIQRGCWYPGLFNENAVLTKRPSTGCGFFNDRLQVTDSGIDPLLCFCKPGDDFCNDGTIDSLVGSLPTLHTL